MKICLTAVALLLIIVPTSAFGADTTSDVEIPEALTAPSSDSESCSVTESADEGSDVAFKIGPIVSVCSSFNWADTCAECGYAKSNCISSGQSYSTCHNCYLGCLSDNGCALP